ncbi:MAG TPA: hypothetical protein HPP83_06190 [Candidatus Hydrogenedentes bacterium]|nr:hypothetical protein [Candidatus Hydrogenedentota bacterium]
MNVQGIGQSPGQANAAGRPDAPAHAAHGTGKRGAAKNAEQTQDPSAATGGENVKGVVRLLQEGHFKGVADVRLRINFYDELAAIEHANMAEVVEDKVPALLDGVNAELDALLASGQLDEEQAATVTEAQGAFNTAIQQAVDQFLNGAGAMNQLVADVQQAFEALAESLSPILEALASAEDGLLAPSDEPPPSGEPSILEGAVAAAGQEDPPPAANNGWETFIADLRGVFNTLLEGLDTGLSAANPLPPLSKPAGNGVAYDKFLAIYNELRGIGVEEATAPSGESEPVDTIA